MLGALALGLVTAALAGCAKPAPDPTPTSTSTSSSPTPSETSPAPTPGPTPPPKPEAWTRNDDTGALAAAQYFMDLFVYANATGDLTDWDAVSGPNCSFCQNTHEDITSVYGGGGRIDGAEATFTDAQVVGSSPSLNVWAIQYAYATASGTAVDAAGTPTHTYEAEDGLLLLNVGWTGEGWALIDGDASQSGAAS